MAAKAGIVLGLSLSVLLLHASAAQTSAPPYRGDNSDWWSIFQGDQGTSKEPEYRPEHSEPSSLNFEVAGIKLGYDEMFQQAAARFGKTDQVWRGDASTGRQQACYVSDDSQTYLIFETGELTTAFYIFKGSRHWDGSEHCAKSVLISSALRTGSGLRLGQSPAEVKNVLGRPTLQLSDRLIYANVVEKKPSPEDLAGARKNNPEMSEKEFRDNFDVYTLSTYIEVRFRNSRASYLVVSKSEQD